MDMKFSSRLALLVVVLSVLLASYPSSFSPGVVVQARPYYVKDLPPVLKNYCTVCHIQSSGRGGLNKFGQDYEASGYSMEAISSKDSDRDGFTNSEELKAGTFPGDPNSTPSSQGSSQDSLIPMIIIIMILILLVSGILHKRKRSKIKGSIPI